MKFELDKEFEKSLVKISKPQKVRLNTLLNDSFISSNTSFKSFDELIDTLGVSTEEELQSISDEKIDTIIQNHSSFDTWQDLLDAASSEYLISQLDL